MPVEQVDASVSLGSMPIEQADAARPFARKAI
jgi:hypothetical protein